MKQTYEKPEVKMISFQVEEPLLNTSQKPDIDFSGGGGDFPFELEDEE